MEAMSDLRKAVFHPLRSYSAAMRFLTIFPGISPAEDDSDYFGAASYFFTIVGLTVGCLFALCGFIIQWAAPPLVSAVVLTILLSSVSGFLHLDGLADTADGFLSSRDRTRCLEIMKDSRIGVMGAAVVCSVMLLKTASIISLDELEVAGGLICAAAAGRTAMVIAMYFLPYARSEGGLGLLFCTGEKTYIAPLLSTSALLIITIFLLPAKLLVLICTFSLIILLFSIWCKKKIGGFTGDTLGCLCELTETGILVGMGLTF